MTNGIRASGGLWKKAARQRLDSLTKAIKKRNRRSSMACVDDRVDQALLAARRTLRPAVDLKR